MENRSQNDIISKAELFKRSGLTARYFDEANRYLAQLGLTNVNKLNVHISKEKIATIALKEHFFIVCEHCKRQGENNIITLASTKTLIEEDDRHCRICRGSASKRSFNQAISQLKSLNIRNLAIVGGFPSEVNRIKTELQGHANLNLVDGTKQISRKLVTPLIKKSDLIIVWCRTPIGHSATKIFKRIGNVVYIYSTSVIGFYSCLISETQLMLE